MGRTAEWSPSRRGWTPGGRDRVDLKPSAVLAARFWPSPGAFPRWHAEAGAVLRVPVEVLALGRGHDRAGRVRGDARAHARGTLRTDRRDSVAGRLWPRHNGGGEVDPGWAGHRMECPPCRRRARLRAGHRAVLAGRARNKRDRSKIEVARYAGIAAMPRRAAWHGSRSRSLRNPIGERRPLNELHHKGRGAVGLFQSVNLRDIRVIEPGEHFRLALEAGQALGVGRHCVWQDLDRDVSLQVGVGRP
jgi:hypothetical protein